MRPALGDDTPRRGDDAAAAHCGRAAWVQVTSAGPHAHLAGRAPGGEDAPTTIGREAVGTARRAPEAPGGVGSRWAIGRTRRSGLGGRSVRFSDKGDLFAVDLLTISLDDRGGAFDGVNGRARRSRARRDELRAARRTRARSIVVGSSAFCARSGQHRASEMCVVERDMRVWSHAPRRSRCSRVDGSSASARVRGTTRRRGRPTASARGCGCTASSRRRSSSASRSRPARSSCCSRPTRPGCTGGSATPRSTRTSRASSVTRTTSPPSGCASAYELRDLPQLAGLFRAGELPWTSVRELTRVVTAQTEDAWLDAIEGKRVDQVQQLVRGKGKGALPDDPVDPAKIRYRIVLENVSAEAYAMHRQARIAAADAAAAAAGAGAGPGAAIDDRFDDDGFVRAYAQAVLQPGVSGDGSGKPPFQVAITTCRACAKTSVVAAGVEAELSPGAAARALCDAALIGDLERDAPERLTATIPVSHAPQGHGARSVRVHLPGVSVVEVPGGPPHRAPRRWWAERAVEPDRAVRRPPQAAPRRRDLARWARARCAGVRRSVRARRR